MEKLHAESWWSVLVPEPLVRFDVFCGSAGERFWPGQRTLASRTVSSRAADRPDLWDSPTDKPGLICGSGSGCGSGGPERTHLRPAAWPLWPPVTRCAAPAGCAAACRAAGRRGCCQTGQTQSSAWSSVRWPGRWSSCPSLRCGSRGRLCSRRRWTSEKQRGRVTFDLTCCSGTRNSIWTILHLK